VIESLSDRMLRENADTFGRMVAHRFVRDVSDDRLPAEVFDRYLVIEGAFVDTAIAIFALATAMTEGIETRRRLIAVLDALANAQVAYFESVLAARRISPAKTDLSAPGVTAFREGMLRIAERGGYAEIVTAMFAAEWMYWTWCKNAARAQISDPHLRKWIDLHAAPDFEAQANWLRAEVDRVGGRLDDVGRAGLVRLFGEVLMLEIGFHDAAYGAA
jgi:thiaminase/transcriptional activator TenA